MSNSSSLPRGKRAAAVILSSCGSVSSARTHTSQPSARLHTLVHAVMLITALWLLDLRELWGQLVRLSVAGIGSLLGRYPVGNTGRARVPIARPMPIAADLRATLDAVEATLANRAARVA